MKSAKDLYNELDYWIMIGIGDDIVTASENRPEYKHLVDNIKARKPNLTPRVIARAVRFTLKKEQSKTAILTKTFWVLLKLTILKKINKF